MNHERSIYLSCKCICYTYFLAVASYLVSLARRSFGVRT